MTPEDRLAAAQKQLRIAASHDEVSEHQTTAIQGVITVLQELEYSVDQFRNDKLAADGGTRDGDQEDDDA